MFGFRVLAPRPRDSDVAEYKYNTPTYIAAELVGDATKVVVVRASEGGCLPPSTYRVYADCGKSSDSCVSANDEGESACDVR